MFTYMLTELESLQFSQSMETGGDVTPRMKRKIFQTVAETLQRNIQSDGLVLNGVLGHTYCISMLGGNVIVNSYGGQKSFEYIFMMYGDPEVAEEQDIMKKPFVVGVTRVEFRVVVKKHFC